MVRALISETGQVVEANIIRGVSQNVGINEAALDAVKRSTFKPGAKDGVRVRSHITLPIAFKL